MQNRSIQAKKETNTQSATPNNSQLETNEPEQVYNT